MEHVPRRILRWTLIVTLVLWAAGVTVFGWGVFRNYAENEHHLVEMLLEGKK